MAETNAPQKPGFVTRFFRAIGVMTAVTIVLIVFAVNRMTPEGAEDLPEKFLLTYDLEGYIGDEAPPTFDGPLLQYPVILRDLVEAIDRGAKDARVKGLAIRLKDADISLAGIQELRSAVSRFRTSGKEAYIFGNSFGGTMRDYYLATAFSQIWLQPVGTVAINGLAVEIPFLKGVLDKIGVSAQFSHKGRYKSAPESLTAEGMSDESREMMTAIVTDLSSQMTEDIARARGLAPDIVKQYVDISPVNDDEALKMRLIDNLGYDDQMLAAAAEKAGDVDIAAVDLLDYSFYGEEKESDIARVEKLFAEKLEIENPNAKPVVALISGVGEVMSYGRGGVLSADDIADAFSEAREDDSVKAVVFRIDSPGGSPEAAETIHRAIVQTRESGKPVVVSMGAYAASGGYWIAAPADKIVAQPGTLTGSIGVFGGKMALNGLWQKIGLKWDSVQSGKNARMFSPNKPFTAEELSKFEKMLDKIYDAFIERVASGRKMERAKVEAAAEGRVFTGRQAKEKGLVDELGGVDKAFTIAKELAKIDPAADVHLAPFPPAKTTLELLIEKLLGGGSGLGVSMNVSAEDIARLLDAKTQPLLMPALQVR